MCCLAFRPHYALKLCSDVPASNRAFITCDIRAAFRSARVLGRNICLVESWQSVMALTCVTALEQTLAWSKPHSSGFVGEGQVRTVPEGTTKAEEQLAPVDGEVRRPTAYEGSRETFSYVDHVRHTCVGARM